YSVQSHGEKNTAFIPLLRPDIQRAIQRSEDLVGAGADTPRSLYRIGGFLLLLGQEYENQSLAMFARAVHWSDAKAAGSLIQALTDVSALAKSYKSARPD